MQYNKAGLSRLAWELEEKGCVLSDSRSPGGNRPRISVGMPGIDRIWPMPASSPAAAMQCLFWDRAELWLDAQSGEIRFRWIYWTLGAAFQHALVSLLVLLGVSTHVGLAGLFCALLAANALPALASLWEIIKLHQCVKKFNHVTACKCS